MSIPNPFKPVCGGTKELPYIQPIMISDNDWSNKETCSFGCKISASSVNPFWINAKPFKALNDTHPTTITHETDKCWEYTYGKSSWWKAQFEKSIVFHGLDFYYNCRSGVDTATVPAVIKIYLDQNLVFQTTNEGIYYKRVELRLNQPVKASLIHFTLDANRANYGGFDIEKIYGFYKH